MEDKYIKLSDAKNAIADYIVEQTVSKYGSLEACMDAKFAAQGAMKELDYIPTADVVSKSEVEEIVRQWKEEANCWQNNYITELRANLDLINRQKAEIERLHKHNTEMARKHYKDGYNDAIKAFAERLKTELTKGSAVMRVSTLDVIEDLVKEMTEGAT